MLTYVLLWRQVLQLQSASTSPESQPVDYESGIEAMILAILQQTTYSQQVQLSDLNSLALLATQANVVTAGQLLSAYSVYLSQALAASANLSAAIESGLLNDTASSSLLPVSSVLLGACWDLSAFVHRCQHQASCHGKGMSA